MTLETPRLLLQSFTLNDSDDLMQLHADPEVNRYLLPTGAWSKEITMTKLKRFIAHQETYGYSKLKVSLKDGTFIGRAGFELWEETKETELGYSFKREYWNQGYATEAARALVRRIFEITDLEHVISFAAEENVASRKVLENIGMAFTDTRLVNDISFVFYKLAREK
jgi:[ribosomal protein S5]-alanine N-acetyltransferase